MQLTVLSAIGYTAVELIRLLQGIGSRKLRNVAAQSKQE